MKNKYFILLVLVIVVFCLLGSYYYISGTHQQVLSYVYLPIETDLPDINEPTGEYIRPPKYYRHYWNRKKEVVAQWVQSAPSHRQLFDGIPSPHSFEEWIEKGRNIPYLEDTLIKSYESRNKYLSNRRLLTILDHIGTDKSLYIIQRFLQDKNETEHIRSNSALALGRKNSTPSSIELLRRIASDSTEPTTLRVVAHVSLGKLQGNKAKPLIENFMSEQKLKEYEKELLLDAIEKIQ